MKTINIDNLYAFSLGATMLGSGGGGHPKILYDLVAYFMELYGHVHVISLDELHDDDLVVPIAFVGAPLINLERMLNTKTFDLLYAQIIKDFPNKNIVLMPAEIGGCNALSPLLLALKYNLSVLDADLIGRAFPKLDMCKPAVLQQSCNPTYLADLMGNIISMHLCNLTLLESIVRDVVVHFGSSAAIATFLFTGKHAHNYVIEHSISRALTMGEVLLQKKNLNINAQTTLLGSGCIVDVYHDMRDGFLFGYAVIKSDTSIFKIHYQNEFLSVTKNAVAIDGSPNIIVLLEKKTGIPLTTESLAFGLDVSIFTLGAPEFWCQPLAYPLVDYKLLNVELL